MSKKKQSNTTKTRKPKPRMFGRDPELTACLDRFTAANRDLATGIQRSDYGNAWVLNPEWIKLGPSHDIQLPPS